MKNTPPPPPLTLHPPCSNIQMVFQNKCKLINIFRFKDKIPIFLHSGIVYKFNCDAGNATNYGKCHKCHFKVKMCEHLGVSVLTGKRLKGHNSSSIKEHHLYCNHSSGFNNFSVIASNNKDFEVTFMESLFDVV